MTRTTRRTERRRGIADANDSQEGDSDCSAVVPLSATSISVTLASTEGKKRHDRRRMQMPQERLLYKKMWLQEEWQALHYELPLCSVQEPCAMTFDGSSIRSRACPTCLIMLTLSLSPLHFSLYPPYSRYQAGNCSLQKLRSCDTDSEAFVERLEKSSSSDMDSQVLLLL